MSMNTWKVERCTPLVASLCRVISTVFMQVVKPIKGECEQMDRYRGRRIGPEGWQDL